MARIILSCLLLFSGTAAAVALPQDAGDGDRPYLVFGFLPIVSSERLVRRFSPLVDYLSQQTGLEIRMETAPDFAAFIRRTREPGRYDILFTAPHLYYLAHRDSGYRAVARVAREHMKAVIVVPGDSDISAPAGLAGRRLATTDPLALATLLARALLRDAGLDPDTDLTLVATPSHNASLLAAYQGNTDAAVLMRPLYLRAPAAVREQMKIIASTRGVPHMPIAVAPWVDEDLGGRLRRALLGLTRSARGRALLQQTGMPGFAPVRGDEYDTLDGVAAQVKVE